MKISTLVSSFNKGGLAVCRACRSALFQSHPPLEVVVCEDYSQDDSRPALRELARQHPTLRVLEYPAKSEDWMMSYLDHTQPLRGDYVHLLAADDYLEQGFYEAGGDLPRSEDGLGTVQQAGADPRRVTRHVAPGVVLANVASRTPSGELISRSRYDLFPGHHDPDSKDLRRWLLRGSLPGGTAIMVSREACDWLRRNGGHLLGPWFDAAGYPAAMAAFGVRYLPEVYGVFTESPGGYGNQRDPVMRQKYRDGADTFFSQDDVRGRLGDEMANAIRDRVKV